MSRVTDTSIPGLTVFWSGHGRLYARVVHKNSNRVALDFTRAPLPFGKREFVKRLDASELTTIDWTVPMEELADRSLFDLAMRVRATVLA